MAIQQGSKVAHADVQAKYEAFNNFIQSFGGSIAKVTIPT